MNSASAISGRISRRGFSLVELLIVLAIMGILATVVLASLSGARKAGRDARRIADLRQVQQSLQLFYLKCGFYPGRFQESACAGGIGNATGSGLSGTNPSNWNALEEYLREAEVDVSSIPHDPIGASNEYKYHVQLKLEGSIPSRAQYYVLEAHLETDHRILGTTDDLDASDLAQRLLPGGSCASPIGTCKNLYPVDVDCEDDPRRGFCVGNLD